RHRGVVENLLPAIAHPRRGDEELWAGGAAQRREVDVARQRLAQWIEIEGIELSRTQGRTERDRASGRRKSADQHQRAERSLVGHPLPESREQLSRALAAALRQP